MEIFCGSRDLEHFLEVKYEERELVKNGRTDYRLHMLLENEIPHLIRPVQSSLDRTVSLRYDTGGLHTLEEFLKNTRPDGAFLKRIFTQLSECMRAIGAYLLPAADLLLLPEYMLYNVKKKELMLVCAPGYGEDTRKELLGLLELFMRRLDHSDQEGLRLLYETYDRLSEEELLPESLLFDPPKRPVWQQAERAESPEPAIGVRTENPEPAVIVREARIRRRRFSLRDLLFLVSIGFLLIFAGLFFVSHGDQKYVILCIATLVAIILQMVFAAGADDEQEDVDAVMRDWKEGKTETENKTKTGTETETVRRLIPLANGNLPEIAPAPGEELVIGRGREESDYRLDNTQISRVHATIRRSGDRLLLVDQGSTNGTFINANRLLESEVRTLAPGDVVSFANEDFFVS